MVVLRADDDDRVRLVDPAGQVGQWRPSEVDQVEFEVVALLDLTPEPVGDHGAEAARFAVADEQRQAERRIDHLADARTSRRLEVKREWRTPRRIRRTRDKLRHLWLPPKAPEEWRPGTTAVHFITRGWNC
jgi:hypothetical protein